MIRPLLALTLCVIFLAAISGRWVFSDTDSPPAISTFLKPEVYRRVLKEREVMTHADLEDLEGGVRHYHFYAAFLVRSNLKKTRAALTNYELYAKIVPYIQRSDFDSKTGQLEILGGIWKFVVSCTLKMEERGERWIHYRVIRGHFQGMEGDILFEPIESERGDLSTLVLLRGDQKAKEFPPRLVIERGAEIVFGFTAQHMRSYVEKGNSQ